MQFSMYTGFPLKDRRLRIFILNGDGEIRTHDPLLARQVLSQLSYTPMAHINVVSLISLNVSCTFQKNPMDVVKYLFN